jgi:hypothetical protein
VPQSADTCFSVLPYVAESAYLRRFICWRLPAVSARCALGGVRSGVSSCGIRHGESSCTLPIYCDGASILATNLSPLLPHRDSVIRDVGYELRRISLPRIRVNRIGAPALPRDLLVGAHPRYPHYHDGASAVLRAAPAYEVRERRASRVPAMPLTTNPENLPPGMNQTARSVTK